MKSINDLIVNQAHLMPDLPLIAYPATEYGTADFTEYTARELDLYADEAAKHLSQQGLKPTVSLMFEYKSTLN